MAKCPYCESKDVEVIEEFYDEDADCDIDVFECNRCGEEWEEESDSDDE